MRSCVCTFLRVACLVAVAVSVAIGIVAAVAVVATAAAGAAACGGWAADGLFGLKGLAMELPPQASDGKDRSDGDDCIAQGVVETQRIGHVDDNAAAHGIAMAILQLQIHISGTAGICLQGEGDLLLAVGRDRDGIRARRREAGRAGTGADGNLHVERRVVGNRYRQACGGAHHHHRVGLLQVHQFQHVVGKPHGVIDCAAVIIQRCAERAHRVCSVQGFQLRLPEGGVQIAATAGFRGGGGR